MRSEADSTLEQSTPEDLSPDVPREDTSEIEDAFRRCMQAALLQAAVAEHDQGSESEVANAFTDAAQTCLERELADLSPTYAAIQQGVEYLQAGVGGIVDGQSSPAPTTPPGPPAASVQRSTGSSSFPWWLILIAVVVILGLAKASRS